MVDILTRWAMDATCKCNYSTLICKSKIILGITRKINLKRFQFYMWCIVYSRSEQITANEEKKTSRRRNLTKTDHELRAQSFLWLKSPWYMTASFYSILTLTSHLQTLLRRLGSMLLYLCAHSTPRSPSVILRQKNCEMRLGGRQEYYPTQ